MAAEQRVSVAFLGPAGTFTELAARDAFGTGADYRESATIAAVFEAVATQQCRFGVVPLENSTEGGVTFTLDSFLEYDVKINAELVLTVEHCLLALKPDLSRIERLVSHPQALAQCRVWIAANLPEAEQVSVASTTAAAREAATDERVAAISSRLAAELFGLTIVRAGIQDRVQNVTRFAVLSLSDAVRTGLDKTSIVFVTPHERGALRRTLSIFDDGGINLTRIESRPGKSKLWEYVFFVDLEGHREDADVLRALERLGEHCGMFKLLGSYPRKTLTHELPDEP